MRINKLIRQLALSIAVTSSATTASADAKENYSPYANRSFPENVYWGDTHVHSNWSADAFAFGNRVTPATAYRFAQGETVISQSGQPARLGRPLDFLVIADHAEFLGVLPMIENGDPLIAGSSLGRRWGAMWDKGDIRGITRELFESLAGENDLRPDPESTRAAWHKLIAIAEQFNRPGSFTAFIGFEWTGGRDRSNLHRNVIFRDGASLAKQVIPLDALTSDNPEDLWKYLSRYEKDTGGRVLAIPHNGNGSKGLMFDDKTLDGGPLTQAYASTRARWEPLYEATQLKGDGEAHPILSPDDRFADYETWETLEPAVLSYDHKNAKPKDLDTYKGEYARSGLERGLIFEGQLGVNPFKFGMIGSSDAHNSLSAIEENNFFGKMPDTEPARNRAAGGQNLFPTKTYAASGRAAVWAVENTRESLFDAMQRREAYATTGPRIVLRFFGGWDFDKRDATRPDFAAIGYNKGVPMGGDLAVAPSGKSPRFLIVAAKDPMGANLERIQVVKGWLDSKGESQEKVFDVVLSDNREPEAKMAEPIKSTVDVKTATYTNTVGEAEMATVWQDPDFDPGQRAFYYVRVLEIPTPRWTTYDAAFYGTELPDGVPAIQQERAYSSPIWYSPQMD